MRPRISLRASSVALVGLFVAAVCSSSRAADALEFSDVVGWWSAEPAFAGETSRVLLHFVDENGKQTVRLSLLGIGGYDVPIGTVTITGDTLDMQPYPFPLRYDANKGTLSGQLPEAAVPIYKIPVEFRRIEAIAKPTPPAWDFARPQVKWTFDAKAPVWAGLERDAATGTIFVGTDAGMLYALDAAGSMQWSFATGKPIKARPAVIGDAVYVTSDSGFLYKLDKRTGAERWRAKVDSGSPERIPTTEDKSRWDRYGSSVVADGKRLYLGNRDKNFYALDLDSGKQVWRVTTQDMMTATAALYRDLVLFADFEGKVRAVSASDGKLHWLHDAQLPVAGDLVVDDGRVFVGSRTYDLIALQASSGKELWRRYYWFSWIESPPVVREHVVYTGSSDGTAVFAIDATNGGLRWKVRVPGWAWARTAVDDDLVVAATVGRGAYPGVRSGSLVGINRKDGSIRWVYLDPPPADIVEKKAEWGFAAAPLLANGVLYAADLNGRIYAVDARGAPASGSNPAK